MPTLTPEQLADYRRKHPHLFQQDAAAVLPAPPASSEAELQAQVKRELVADGWSVWEIFKGSARGGSVFATKGIPDLYVFRPGLTAWLELKQPGNGPTAEQLARHAELRAAGIPVGRAWTLDEALYFARHLEIP